MEYTVNTTSLKRNLMLTISAVLLTLSTITMADTSPRVMLETKYGDIELQLFPDLAPKHVENFIQLTESGFYNGTIFHRVIPDFMIQGGDPNTKGTDKSIYGRGGPGHTVKAEFSRRTHKRGILSMARTNDPDSAGSQFFIVTKDSPFLDMKYTVFGEVTNGMKVVDQIAAQRRDNRDNPLQRIEINAYVIKDKKTE